MHIYAGNGSPLYNAEARQRWHSYPPPYYSNGSWYYVTPWLWYDGNPDGGYNPNTWRRKIVNRMNQPSPVTLTMWGDYAADGSGTVYAKFRNDSTASLNGRIIFVITEDSIYYHARNGDLWHNHVARDYLPDQNGQTVTIASGDSVTISRSFTIQSGWDESKCEIVAWIQSDVLQSDSTKEIWQGGKISITELSIKEKENNKKSLISNQVNLFPNPCMNSARFEFTMPLGSEYCINIYDVTGREVKTIKARVNRERELVKWNLKDNKGEKVKSGVYFYKFTSRFLNTSGKIVVR